MPLPLLAWFAAAAALGGGGWAAWRMSRGEPVIPDGAIPWIPGGRDAVIARWAERHDVDPLLVRAIVDVESGGRADVAGRPVARLEVHHLEAAVPRAVRPQLARILRRSSPPGQPWVGHQVDLGDGWQPLHHQPGELLEASQAREWAALALARQVAGDEAAIRSTSIGLGQLLGRHHGQLGYASAADMLADAQRGEAQQVRQLLAFVERDSGGAALRGLQAGDLRAVAGVYNGDSNATAYAGKIQRRYEQLRGTA